MGGTERRPKKWVYKRQIYATDWNGGYVLNLDGEPVYRCSLDRQLRLLLGTSGVEIVIASPFELVKDEDRWVLDPERPEEIAPAFQVLWRIVSNVTVENDGRLVIGFFDGTIVNVPSDPDYEAWEIVAENGLRLICMPGGEVAYWAPRSDKS
jgi:hypothetical protein